MLFLLISLIQVSCTSNDNGEDDEPTPIDVVVPVNQANLVGSWQLYYFTKQVNSGLTLRYLLEDGYGITLFAEGSDGKSRFKETDARDIVTNQGTYTVIGSDSIKFEFKSLYSGEDTTSTVSVARLSDKRLTTYDKYTMLSKDKSVKYNVFDVRVFRNMKTMPNDYPGVDKEPIVLEKLFGKWEVYSYRFFVNGQAPANIAEIQAKNIGVVYYFYKDGNGKSKFKLYDNTQILRDQGDLAVIDDVIHLYFNANDNNGVEKEYHLAIKAQDWGERTESGTGAKIEAFTDYAKYISFPEGSTTPTPYELYSDMKRIE